MKQLIFSLSVFFLLSLIFTGNAVAVYNPLSVPNNKYGIHILFPSELQEAAKLVNGAEGEWGYVLIPIQAGDKDLEKWQQFMDDAKKLKLVPIIRLATEGDYFNTSVWRKPKEEDILDFANFLDSLQWPLKHRYIIIFNEVNRADEWGGTVNPQEYASLLSYAVTVFKSKSDEFFIISAGLDNAAPNAPGYMNQYDYIRAMNVSVPGIFNQVDGLSSHSYPNPAFSQPPHVSTSRSIASFQFEREMIKQMTSGKELPVFITETGWTGDIIADELRAEYYRHAFENTWSDPGLVTVIPFILTANAGPFKQFSFLNENGAPTKQYEMFRSLPKTKGRPILTKEPKVLAADSTRPVSAVSVRNFSDLPEKKPSGIGRRFSQMFSWMMRI